MMRLWELGVLDLDPTDHEVAHGVPSCTRPATRPVTGRSWSAIVTRCSC